MPSPMPLKPTTVRFAEDGMKIVQDAAEKSGSTVSQFIREAAIMRALVVLGRDETFVKLAEEVDKLARDGD